MIVGIIKTGAGLIPVEEFRRADTESQEVTDFCAEHTPPLNEADYMGANGDALDLRNPWGWDFSEATPLYKVIPEANPMNEIYTQTERDGREYFKLAKAKYFGVKLQSGELTVANLSYVYTKLTEVAMRLNNGDQGLALHYLVNDLGAITQTDIDNGYTQEVHDNIVADITNYLTP